MPEYLAPGVYVEEVDTGAKPIEGVSTTTTGMVGVTERGPVNVPTLVTGVADFRRQFGWYMDRRVYTGTTWYLPHSVKGFFDNGGKRLYLVRILPDQATAAEATLFDRGDAVAGFVTTLASRAEQDEAVLIVADTAGIGPGEAFLINDGASSEYRSAEGNLALLVSPAGAAQAAEAVVVGYTIADDATARAIAGTAAQTGDAQIQLDVVAGLTAAGGDILLVDHGVALTDIIHISELVVTTSADPLNAAIPVTLSAPLAYDHVIGAGVALVTTTQVGTTELVHAVSAGDRVAVIEDDTQITGSQIIGFGGPPSTEYHALGDPGVASALTQLSFNHNAGALVSIMTTGGGGTLQDTGAPRNLQTPANAATEQLTLDNRAGLVSGSILGLTDGAGTEYVIVDSVAPGPDPGVVTLTQPLRRTYPLPQTAQQVTDTAVDTTPTLLARDANPGESVLVLTDSGAYPAGSVVRIEQAGSPIVEFHELVASTAGIITLNEPVDSAHAAGLPIESRSEMLIVQAIDRGSWGNSLRVIVEDDTPILETRPTSFPVAGDPDITFASTVGIEPGTILEFYRLVNGVFTSVFLQKAESVAAANHVGFGPGGVLQNVTNDMLVRTREFRMTTNVVRLNVTTQKEEVVPGMTETLRSLSMDPRHSRYVVRVAGPIPGPGIPVRDDGRTEGESDFIRAEDVLTVAQAEATLRLGPDVVTVTLPSGRVATVPRALSGGDDAIGSVTDNTYIGLDAINPIERSGLFALKNIEEISIVAIPGRTTQRVQQELITHCELLRYRFAVLDSRFDDGVAEVQEQRGLYDTKYAALYYPWLRIIDPFPDNPRMPGEVEIPPSGHVAGIYARSDIERGVHKAPANEVIRSISDLEFKLTKEEQDILNPRNINVLRNFRENNRGLRVWGARVLSSDPDWKYVNVRRLFIFVEHSIDNGTQWVVFEPNSEPLWERVRRAVSAFLTNVWRDGALMGKTKEEAFFVKVDRTTMTQADIDNGRLIVLVGIAPVKPAEFVIFRIGQFVGGSSLEEG